MVDERKFYRVINGKELWDLRLPNHFEHGYETDRDFRRAVRALVDRWKNREGECIEKRHDHLRLRFHDTAGGVPDEAWLPVYLLIPIPIPEYVKCHENTEEEELKKELYDAFGFD